MISKQDLTTKLEKEVKLMDESLNRFLTNPTLIQELVAFRLHADLAGNYAKELQMEMMS